MLHPCASKKTAQRPPTEGSETKFGVGKIRYPKTSERVLPSHQGAFKYRTRIESRVVKCHTII